MNTLFMNYEIQTLFTKVKKKINLISHLSIRIKLKNIGFSMKKYNIKMIRLVVASHGNYKFLKTYIEI